MPQFTAPRPSRTGATLKPRNPMVAPSRLRVAGRHAEADARQAAQRELARNLRELWSPPRDA